MHFCYTLLLLIAFTASAQIIHSSYYDSVLVRVDFALIYLGGYESTYINHVRDGWSHQYNSKKQIVSSDFYRDNSLLTRIQHLRRGASIETAFKNGQRHGREVMLSRKGSVIWENIYIHGVRYLCYTYGRKGRLRSVSVFHGDKICTVKYR